MNMSYRRKSLARAAVVNGDIDPITNHPVCESLERPHVIIRAIRAA